VDLSGLEFIDAAGVAALSRSSGQARNAGGDLLLVGPQRQVQRVLALIWRAEVLTPVPAGPRQPPVRAALTRWRPAKIR
jgi:anti-anti-sigma factor